MLKIGLTGGIGAGKSEVSKFFKLWGAYIFDADQESKTIIDTNEIAQKEIIEEFGTLNQIYIKSPHFEILCMGMSQDFKIANKCGSNMFRIGSYIFS